MSYNELGFKSEVIATAQNVYNLNELKFNPWVNDGANSTARTDYLNSKGAGYVDPQAGIGKVTVSSLSSSTAWKVYKKSNQQNGDMFMGRLADTGKLYEEFGLGTPQDAVYNLSAGKPINVQKLKDWTILINDCWMLGAIHKQRTFNLVSKISSTEDIWNPRGYFIVTGRELWALINFGYKPERNNSGISFVCDNPAQANSATLTKYAQLANAAAGSQVAKAKIALFAQGIY